MDLVSSSAAPADRAYVATRETPSTLCYRRVECLGLRQSGTGGAYYLFGLMHIRSYTVYSRPQLLVVVCSGPMCG